MLISVLYVCVYEMRMVSWSSAVNIANIGFPDSWSHFILFLNQNVEPAFCIFQPCLSWQGLQNLGLDTMGPFVTGCSGGTSVICTEYLLSTLPRYNVHSSLTVDK